MYFKSLRSIVQYRSQNIISVRFNYSLKKIRDLCAIFEGVKSG